MRMLTLPAITLALLAASSAASAAQATAHFYTHTISQTRTTLPNGNTSVLTRYYIHVVPDNADDPMGQRAGNCMGESIVAGDGKEIAASGICFTRDPAGNSVSHWWKMDEAGTAKCPHVCGHYGFLPGTGSGKFKGVTGGGTFVRTLAFGDEGSSGTARGTYKMP